MVDAFNADDRFDNDPIRSSRQGPEPGGASRVVPCARPPRAPLSELCARSFGSFVLRAEHARRSTTGASCRCRELRLRVNFISIRQPNVALLGRVADATGGTRDPEARGVRSVGREGHVPRGLVARFVGAAIVLLLLDRSYAASGCSIGVLAESPSGLGAELRGCRGCGFDAAPRRGRRVERRRGRRARARRAGHGSLR